ncbi:NHLP bacteriocin export ABC transporter permease/ATPase subunit [Desulfotomaculum sp. 1211_IL3151]|uniref:NHLP bacteriocin export ABC transporter permease/ATPase subunit n=1 Tax=Desulfotomaculum sp. 1211_IL3151 TaxID=3084055 RepID=UPI002FDB68D3
MQIPLDLFSKEGTTLPVEGNKPLLLTDTASVWLVEQGSVNLFYIEVKADQPVGKRNFLMEVKPGQLLFGVAPQGESTKFGLLAAGSTGTVLKQLRLEQHFTDFIDEATKNDFYILISQWVERLAKNGVTRDQQASALINQWQGEASLANLKAVNEAILLCIRQQARERIEQEQRRFKEREKYDQTFMRKAIVKLAAVSQNQLADAVIETVGADALLTVTQMVGKAMQINIKTPLQYQERPSRDQLGDIARASQARVRQVALRGEWWLRDNGPLIAYLEEDNRPVALLPLSPTEYQLYDPAKGIKVKVNRQLAQGVKPFGYTFYRPFPNKALNYKDLLRFGFDSTWKRDLVMIILMGALGGILGMLIPMATGVIFDSIIPQGQQTQLLQISFILAASALATMLFQLTRSIAMLRLEGKMEGSIQAAVWDRLLSLPTPFFRQFSSGELAMRAMGISTIRQMLSGVTINSIITATFSVFNLGLLFYYNVKLALFAILLVLIAILVTLGLGYFQIRYERQTVDISNRIAGFVLQVFSGVSKFRVSGTEKRAFYLWAKDFGEQRKISFKSERIANILVTFNSVFPLITSMVIFYVLLQNMENPMGAGKFIAFNAAFGSFMGNMISLSNSVLAVNGIIPLYERAKPILEELPEYDEAKGQPGELTGEIEVSHLSFRYKADGPLILQDVSLRIHSGEYVGLVGTSGSGKSTLFRLLLGFEKPENGRIYYNGQDLSKVDIRAVRKQLGVVLQNGQLMSGDIFTNIVGSNPNLTMDDALEAAKMAGLDKDIEQMPMKMHTVVSEGGGTLSGGQRQRLLIARAIVNRPKILYFDEATSALDNMTQAIVSQSLENLKATRVVIAHRLSTVMNCDRIIVMDKGSIVEDGSYEELMGQQGVFAELARRQLA